MSRTWIVLDSSVETSTSTLSAPSVKASFSAYPSGLASLTPDMSSLPVYGFRLIRSRLNAVSVNHGTTAFATDVPTGLIQSGSVRSATTRKSTMPTRDHNVHLRIRRQSGFLVFSATGASAAGFSATEASVAGVSTAGVSAAGVFDSSVSITVSFKV